MAITLAQSATFTSQSNLATFHFLIFSNYLLLFRQKPHKKKRSIRNYTVSSTYTCALMWSRSHHDVINNCVVFSLGTHKVDAIPCRLECLRSRTSSHLQCQRWRRLVCWSHWQHSRYPEQHWSRWQGLSRATVNPCQPCPTMSKYPSHRKPGLTCPISNAATSKYTSHRRPSLTRW